jgi:phage-related protein
MPTFQAISDWITGTMVPFVQEHWPEIKAGLLGIGAALAAAGVVSIVMGIATAIAGLLSPVGLIIALVGVLAVAWSNNWGGIQEKTAAAIAFMQNILGVLASAFSGTWENLKIIFQAFQAAFQGDWHKFGELMRVAWDNWMNTLKTNASNAVQAVLDFFRNTDWGQVGRNILEGIARGITNGLSIIVDAAKGAAQAALDAAKGFLGIKSPSTVFAKEVGEPSAEGFGKGFAAKMDSIGAGMGAEAISSFGSAPAVSGGGGGGGGINFTYVDQRFISLSDEYDAERVLAPILERFLTNRGYQAVRAG